MHRVDLSALSSPLDRTVLRPTMRARGVLLPRKDACAEARVYRASD